MNTRRVIVAVLAGLAVTGIAGGIVAPLDVGVAVETSLAYVVPDSLPYNLFEDIVDALIAGIMAIPGLIVVAVIVGWGRTTPDRETRCRQCGYILRGLTVPRCPECGTSI